jgi:hypothetical protein
MTRPDQIPNIPAMPIRVQNIEPANIACDDVCEIAATAKVQYTAPSAPYDNVVR